MKLYSQEMLQDHMREAGDVCYADVYRDGTGVVEYARYEDVKYAIRKLDDTKFRSHEVCPASPSCCVLTNDTASFRGRLRTSA